MGNRTTKTAPKNVINDDNKSKERIQEATPPLLPAADELDKKWKEFYAGTVAKYHRERSKFLFLGSLAKSYKVKKIENRQYGYWYKDEEDQMTPKCDSVYADFSINFTLKYNSSAADLKLSAIFNNKKYALFDDNFATKDWVIKLILLNQDVKDLWIHFFSSLPIEFFMEQREQNVTDIIPIIYEYLFYSKTEFIDDIYLYKNGHFNDVNCGLLDGLMEIHLEEGNLHIADFFDILLQWFLSQDATNYRKMYVETDLIWQN